MDKIVIDSGVAVKWYITESYSAEALRIMNDYQAGRLELLAPDLIYAEIGNVAWKKRRFQGLGVLTAQKLVTEFCALSLTLTTSAVLLDDAYNLAVAYGRSCYDALLCGT